MKIELKSGTVETLKEINAKMAELSDALKKHYSEYMITMRALNSQKSIILGTVIKEKELDPEKKYILHEDYTLEEISDESFEELVANENNSVIDTVDVSIEKN